MKLQTHPVMARESVRFVAERDSLNASILGPDAGPGTPEFDLFVKEVAREMTVKAGQKCTAIRRAMAPAQHLDAVQEALAERLAKVRIGDPRDEATQMGALASREQLAIGARGGLDVVESGADRERRSRRRRRSRATAPSSRRSCCAPTIPGTSPMCTMSRRSGRFRR